MAGRKFQIGNVSLYIVKKDYSYLCMWMTSDWLGRNRILIRCGNYSTKKSIWENQHLSLIMYTWAALKDNAKQAKKMWTITDQLKYGLEKAPHWQCLFVNREKGPFLSVYVNEKKNGWKEAER